MNVDSPVLRWLEGHCNDTHLLQGTALHYAIRQQAALPLWRRRLLGDRPADVACLIDSQQLSVAQLLRFRRVQIDAFLAQSALQTLVADVQLLVQLGFDSLPGRLQQLVAEEVLSQARRK